MQVRNSQQENSNVEEEWRLEQLSRHSPPWPYRSRSARSRRRRGAPARRAVGGTTAGNDAYPTDDQWKNSKEAQALVAKAKAAAGNDAKLQSRFDKACTVLGPQRPAVLRQNAGLPAEPQRQVDIVKLFDNFYFFGFNTVGAWAVTTNQGIILIDSLNTVDEAEKIIEPALDEGRSQAGGREDDHRRPWPLRSFRRRAVLPAEVRVEGRHEQARLGHDRAAEPERARSAGEPSAAEARRRGRQRRPEGDARRRDDHAAHHAGPHAGHARLLHPGEGSRQADQHPDAVGREHHAGSRVARRVQEGARLREAAEGRRRSSTATRACSATRSAGWSRCAAIRTARIRSC